MKGSGLDPPLADPRSVYLYYNLLEAEILSSTCIQKHNIQERHLMASPLIHELRNLSSCMPGLLRLDEELPGLRGRLGMFSSLTAAHFGVYRNRREWYKSNENILLILSMHWEIIWKGNPIKDSIKIFNQSLLFQETLFLSCLDTGSSWKQLTCREK